MGLLEIAGAALVGAERRTEIAARNIANAQALTMLAALLMLAAASGPATVPVVGDVVRVRDVARAPGAGHLALIKLGKPATTLTPDELWRLVANRLPGARFSLLHRGAVRLVRHVAPRVRPAPVEAEPTGVIAGQDLVLRSAAGPVVIERKVVTLQPSRPGRRVFVRTDDGAVVSARVRRATTTCGSSSRG